MVELLATDIGVGPFAAAGDSAPAEHNALLGHTTVVAEPSGSECTMVATLTIAMVRPSSVDAME